jgi:hypothetical protein
MTIPAMKALPKTLQITDTMITFVVLKPSPLILVATKMVGGRVAVTVGEGVGGIEGGFGGKAFVTTCLEVIVPICSCPEESSCLLLTVSKRLRDPSAMSAIGT